MKPALSASERNSCCNRQSDERALPAVSFFEKGRRQSGNDSLPAQRTRKP
jgi:hypothetical protein